MFIPKPHFPSGMATSWMGEGLSNPDSVKPFRVLSDSMRPSKVTSSVIFTSSVRSMAPKTCALDILGQCYEWLLALTAAKECSDTAPLKETASAIVCIESGLVKTGWKVEKEASQSISWCRVRQKPHVGFAHALSPLSQPALFTCSWSWAKHARDSRQLQDKSWILGKFYYFSCNCSTKYV